MFTPIVTDSTDRSLLDDIAIDDLAEYTVEEGERRIRASYRAGRIRANGPDGKPLSEDELIAAVDNASKELRDLAPDEKTVVRFLLIRADTYKPRGDGEDKKINWTLDIQDAIRMAQWTSANFHRFWHDPIWKEVNLVRSPKNVEALMALLATFRASAAEATIEFDRAIKCMAVYATSCEKENRHADSNLRDIFLSNNWREETLEATLVYAEKWRQSAFSRVSIPHKLAAALCLTDRPKDELHPPFHAWSLIIPQGIFEPDQGAEDKDGTRVGVSMQLARVWCLGLEPVLGVYDVKMDIGGAKTDSTSVVFFTPWLAEEAARIKELLFNLVAGVAVVMSNNEGRRRGRWGFRYARGSKEHVVHLGDNWEVTKSVQIDLRQDVREISAGRKRGGNAPKAAWIVRGHWRNQPHGPGRGLHRRQWIEPYWKGDGTLRTLIRGTDIKD